MVSSLRTLSSASSSLPAAALVASAATLPSSSSSSSSSPSVSKPHQLSFSSSLPRRSPRLRLFGCSRSLSSTTAAAAAFHMASVTAEAEQKNGELPELLTEFMVDMKCDGCVSAVKNKLEKLDGVKRVDVDLGNQVVRILGSLPVKTMAEALEQTGRKARLIGQGSPEDFVVSAAVAEFKGPVIFGVVRLAQVNMELARIEANFSGLSPGKHSWSINEFGDLTRGAASTGNIFNAGNHGSSEQPIGDLGTLEVQENGEAHYTGAKRNLRVVDLIGRSIVVYGTEDKSNPGIAAAVIARSAGVGENYKKLCTCDGVTIWESS